MEHNEWVLPLRDGTNIKISADKIKDLNNKLANKEPIRADGRTILWHEIAAGPRLYTTPEVEPGLAEAAAIAFQEPILDDDGQVKCTWVKEEISATQWNKYYANFSSYHKLSTFGDHVTIAYRLPLHMTTPVTPRCTDDEVKFLQTRLE